jgi:hypothetical protein
VVYAEEWQTPLALFGTVILTGWLYTIVAFLI